MNNYRRRTPWDAGSTIINLIIFVVIALALFWLAGQIYRVLLFVSPVLIIAAAIIDHRVIIGYVKTLWAWLRHRTLLGVVAVIFTLIGYPLVFTYLLIKAILSRKARKVRKESEKRKMGEYIEYEEVEEEVFELPDFERSEERLDK